MINRRTVLKTAAVGAAQAVALPYLAREGFAQTPAHVLKLTMADTRNHPLYQVLLRFADNVKKKTNGAVEVQVSLPKTRFERTGDAIRPRLHVRRCPRSGRSGARPAHPFRAKHEDATHYNRRRISQGSASGALR